MKNRRWSNADSSAEGADRAQATIFCRVGLYVAMFVLSQLSGQALDTGSKYLGGGPQVLGNPEHDFGIEDVCETS